jgi:hypothetical protein
MGGETRGRGPVDRFIDAIEVMAAGFLAAVVSSISRRSGRTKPARGEA